MTINVAAGAAAYANAAKTLTSAQGAGAASGTGFGDMLKSTLEGAINDQQKGEMTSMQAVAGKADINSVVAAVTNADVTLQTVVAVRDKVVSAYQEILHMTV
ncbi:MAG TPA: flagellar hook-basal body complex protein FliE [Aliidongia sp.]|uniref:flagellar hook-basal body complex protein FliE n=1 Tax=Aliidongia sp. TaxID=1914230 RepID=UPI002DDD1105|nr:flagellar hook-basal body complex protein FliE [Aliidongia sp.]HEV2674228.1 flagellar hook-basal body complex protein FliE [Aliidongia sp.]